MKSILSVWKMISPAIRVRCLVVIVAAGVGAYADNITPEQAVEIVKYAAPVMDPDVPNDELQDVLDYLSGTKDYHNGYFGNLCMTYNEIYGQLMLRTN